MALVDVPQAAPVSWHSYGIGRCTNSNNLSPAERLRPAITWYTIYVTQNPFIALRQNWN